MADRKGQNPLFTEHGKRRGLAENRPDLYSNHEALKFGYLASKF